MCIFVDEWDCNFAGQEITLEICKTCIDARRLHSETKHDRALQERMKRKEQMSRQKEPEPGIVPEREKPKERPKERPEPETTKEILTETPTETPAETPMVEEKSPLKAIQKEIFSDEVEENNILDILGEETPEEKSEDEGTFENLEPASIVEMKNLEGSIEDIRNDPTKPTDTWLETKEEDKETLLKADFPNPPDKLQIGEDKQEFLVRVRRTEDEFFFPPYPEINVKVCEDDDVLVETGRIEVEDVHGEVISLSWNAGELLDLYGTDVEIIIEGFGAGDEGTQNRIEIGAVRWRAMLVESTARIENTDDQTLEEKLLSPLQEEATDETMETIRSDINPLE